MYWEKKMLKEQCDRQIQYRMVSWGDGDQKEGRVKSTGLAQDSNLSLTGRLSVVGAP